VSHSVPVPLPGPSYAVAVDSASNSVVVAQDATTEIGVCAFNLPSQMVAYQQGDTGLGTVQVADLATLGSDGQFAFWDNNGVHLGLVGTSGLSVLDLPDSDFTAATLSGCYPIQLAPTPTDVYLVENCLASGFGYEVAAMREFDVDGHSVPTVTDTPPVSSTVTSLFAHGLAMDPATFASGPEAWLVGNGAQQGFLAHYTAFGSTPIEDSAFDVASQSLDAIGFAPDGGTFAVLAQKWGGTGEQIRTYTAVASTDTSTVLAAGGQSSDVPGGPAPIWPSGIGAGHSLAWADDQTVFFITTEGLFLWHPFQP
jgi:hypothetical protein